MGIRSTIRTFVLGAAAGAAAIYFNDPERGKHRREEFVEKASTALDGLNQAADSAKDLAGQASQDAREVGEEVKGKASELADKARDSAEDLAGEGHKTADEPSWPNAGSSISLDQPSQTPTAEDSLLMPGDRRP